MRAGIPKKWKRDANSRHARSFPRPAEKDASVVLLESCLYLRRKASMPREKDVSTRLDEVERIQRRHAEEIEQLQRELRALGVELPELSPAGRTPLSPQARLAALRLAAAKARAAKPIGDGKGAVSDEAVAEQLARQAEEESETP